jgi:DNA-binding IclR family transcriptional regulator
MFLIINDRKKLLALHEEGIGATKIAQQMGIGRSTVYKLLERNP